MITQGEIISVTINGEPVGKLTEHECDVEEIDNYPKAISGSGNITWIDGYAWLLFEALWYSEYYRN